MTSKEEQIRNLRKQIKQLEDEIAMERLQDRKPPTGIVDKMKDLGLELDEPYIGVWDDNFHYLSFAATNYKTIDTCVYLFGNRKMNKLYCYQVYANNFKIKIGLVSDIVELTDSLNELKKVINGINKTRKDIANAFPGLIDASEDIRETYNQLKKNNVLEAD